MAARRNSLPAIRATGHLSDLAGCEAFLVVTPAQHLRAILSKLPAAGKPLVLCAKGIEEKSGLLMHEVAKAVQPGSPIAVLSGPTFAHEVAAGLPTAVHPHMLRHSYASHLLQSSGDLRAVQELLGHANITTTQVYTRLDFQHLAKAYDAAHPRAKKRC